MLGSDSLAEVLWKKFKWTKNFRIKQSLTRTSHEQEFITYI